MSLPNNLVRQFAKAVNEEKKTKAESSLVMGTVQKSGDKTYVQIDGSDSRTPVASTTDVLDGERVTVVIKNHEAFITGNFSAPSARSKDVQALEKVVADKVDARELTAVKADINNLHTKTLDIDDRLTAQRADIDEINTENANISKKLTAQEAEIGTLSGDVANFKKTTTDTLEAQSGKIEQLTSDNVTINETLTAQDASIKNLETENTTVKGRLDANEASIKTIDGDVAKFKETTTGTLNAHAGKINELVSDNLTINETLTAQDASIKNLSSEKLSAKDIEGKFANIDFSNIQKAAIKNFFSESGMIKDLVVGDQTITGELVGVTISGDLIKGNTVVADKLVVKGEDGLYYKLNTDGMTVEKEQTDYNSLNGQIIKAKSITATKISVDDLVAFGATIGGFKIGQDSIYSGVKETVNNTTRGIYMDNDGQIAFGDSSQYIKFYRVSEGKYKLSIAVDDLYIGSKSVSESIEDVSKAIDNVRDEITTLLRIESSRGTVFKNDQVSTILSVVLYHGKQRITDASTMREVFGSGAYLQWKWQRLDDASFGVISSTDNRFGDDGFTFTLSPEDVDTKVTFMCELIV